MVAAAIDLQKISKNFGSLVALHPTELTVSKGEYVLVIGANGAGKTTLLRLVAGVSRPSSGRVFICGKNLRTNAENRAKIGLLTHHSMLYEDLTAEENLRFYSQLYCIKEKDLKIEHSLELMDLNRWRHRKVSGFSRGMRQRLSIARAIIHNPSVLLLDEPYSGLDPTTRETLQKLLLELKTHGHTFLMATHRLEDAAPLADRVIVIETGQIIVDEPWQGSASELAKLFESRKERTL